MQSGYRLHFDHQAVGLAAAVALCQVVALAACSVVVDPKTKQCEIDDDCTAMGGAFIGSICGPEQICTRPRCATHADCAPHFGAGQGYCRVDGFCANLFTNDCTKLVPANALEGDRPLLLVGFMAILAGDNASYGTPQLQGAELAIGEIDAFGGLPPLEGDTRQRRLAMLVCNHGDSPQAVARHLIDGVGVPAIVGASFSGVTLNVFDVARESQVLVFSPSATSPALTTYSDQNLLWRTAPSDNLQTEAMKLLVQQIEAALSRTGVLAATEPLRLSMPFKGDAAGRALFQAATSRSEAVPNPAPPLVGAGFEYEDPDPNRAVDWPMYVQRILRDKPHIIIPLGTGEFVTNMLDGIETGWTEPRYRPWYLLPEGNKVAPLLEYAQRRTDLMLAERVVGTAPGARQSEGWGSFLVRFRASVQPPTDPGNLAEFAYDAVYLVGYAAAIAKQIYPSGRQLADGLGKVSCADAPLIKAGPFMTQGMFGTAARTGCINFEGVSGPLDFDEYGEAPSDYAIWCLKGSGMSFEPALDTYYSYGNGMLVTRTPGAGLDFSRTGWCN